MNTLAILLHGVGSSGDDLAGLGAFWSPRLPETIFASPDGPEHFDQGGPGYQWFSLMGVTPANRPARIAAARAAFDTVIGEIIDQHGFTDRLDRVALVGFSQGSIMALDAVMSGRWPVGVVVAYSGRMASPAPYAPSLSTPVHLIHGDADPVIPVSEAHAALAALTGAGMRAQLQVERGVDHTISAEGAALGESILAAF